MNGIRKSFRKFRKWTGSFSRSAVNGSAVMKKITALAVAVCFFLLPVTALAGEPADYGRAGELAARAVNDAPVRTAKPAKFPAGRNAPAAKSVPKPGGRQPSPSAVKKPAVKPPPASGTEGAKTSIKAAKPAKKEKPPKKAKKSRKKKDKDAKKTGDMKIACRETAPFFPAKKVEALIKTAKKYIGVKYVYGGADPKGFDCSGYIMYIFKSQGSKVPRGADDQYDIGRRVEGKKRLVKGDLVFFSDDRREISHVGLYLGNGSFIHASTSKGVRIDSLSNEYWKPRYAGGKHLIK